MGIFKSSDFLAIALEDWAGAGAGYYEYSEGMHHFTLLVAQKLYGNFLADVEQSIGMVQFVTIRERASR